MLEEEGGFLVLVSRLLVGGHFKVEFLAQLVSPEIERIVKKKILAFLGLERRQTMKNEMTSI